MYIKWKEYILLFLLAEPPCTLKNGRAGVYKQYKYCKVFWTVPVSIKDESLSEKCELSECNFSETVCCPTGGPVIKEKVYARPIATGKWYGEKIVIHFSTPTTYKRASRVFINITAHRTIFYKCKQYHEFSIR